MLTSQQRQRSKSSRRIRMKSPLGLRHKISLQQNSQEKVSIRKSNGSTSDSNQSQRKAFARIHQNHQNSKNSGKNLLNTEGFKNKILVSSCQFNKLKQQLQSNGGILKSSEGQNNKRKNDKKLKIKIFDGLSKHSSSNSQKTNTINTSSGSSESEQIQLLKIENQYFKQIYDQALGQLSKLKNKLKQEKKVHDVEKQIYQNQINKLKRIVDSQKEEVSHVIFDEDNRCIIVVSTIDGNQDTEGVLGLDSDCDDDDTQVSSLSIMSK